MEIILIAAVDKNLAIGKDGKIAETFSSITKPTSKKFLKIIDPKRS